MGEMIAFTPDSLDAAEVWAEKISKSALIPADLRRKPWDVLVTLLSGLELGLSPMQSLRGIHVIEGKPTLAASTAVALVMRERDVCAYFHLVESTDEVATYETLRAGHPEPVRMSYTIGQATAAGLSGRSTWKKYPAAMLRSRAAIALARAVYPDLVDGIYTPDEGEEIAAGARVVVPTSVTPPHKDLVQRACDAFTGVDLTPEQAERYSALVDAKDIGGLRDLYREATGKGNGADGTPVELEVEVIDVVNATIDDDVSDDELGQEFGV